MLLEQTLHQPFREPSWQTLLTEIFANEQLDLLQHPQKLHATEACIQSVEQLGKLILTDGNVLLLNILTSNQVQLDRNRATLSTFLKRFLNDPDYDAVLAVFHQPNHPNWRITYASIHVSIDSETGIFQNNETEPKRFSLLVGSNEPCRTAAERLAQVQQLGQDLGLAELEKAFSVEKLSKEFFDKYLIHYEAFVAELLSPELVSETRTLFEVSNFDDVTTQTKADKPIRDFVKKLLGRLVFLYFLQKKHWLGCSLETSDWSDGPHDFLDQFFKQAQAADETAHFHSRYLTKLFFEALNTERKDYLFPLTGTRIPYLNGGLFDPDPEALQRIDFSAESFEALFDFLGQYNFTIDENDPNQQEVGIDPEMLGHIFENLLEDNKDKGAYYTPKPIVAYMCQQSLLHYLESHLGQHESLTRLLTLHDAGDLQDKDNWCRIQAKRIATLLTNVKICDPAIGSGAFPIGMLNEIVYIRTLLNAELHDPEERAKLKRSIIQKSIYGVDLDLGAVEIARLRFWLALVVDEQVPSPLPNLDYKIMQGNSLLERFGGVDLSKLHIEDNSTQPIGGTALELDLGLRDMVEQKEFEVSVGANLSRLLEARKKYFAARKPETKQSLRNQIDTEIINHIRECLEFELERVDILIDQHEKMAAGTYPKTKKWSPKQLTAYLKKRNTIRASLDQLENVARRTERPFFLWRLLFQDVFAEGGFDIVIANPPYVRQELIKEQKPLIEEAGYKTYTGTADLLVYFYEQGSNLLKQGGVLTYITSNKFYRAGYGKKLRSFLTSDHTLHTLIDFKDAPVFNGVIAYASILVAQKETAAPNNTAQALPWDLNKEIHTLPKEIEKSFPVTQNSLTEDGWRLVSAQVNALLKKLRDKGTPLGEYVKGRFYYGIKTGFNEAFVIDGKKRAELITADPKSEEVIKPFLRGRDVKRWQAKQEDRWLIFTRSGIQIEKYPAIKSHLEKFRTQLEPKPKDWPIGKEWNGRKSGSYKWYEIQDNIAYWKEYNEKQIGWGNLATKPQFSSIEAGKFLSAPAVSLVSSESWLCAYLNSYITHYLIKMAGAERQNGYYEFKPMYVEPLPIPSITATLKSKLSELADRCAAATAADDLDTLTVHEAAINKIVYQLFELNDDEIALIETSLSRIHHSKFNVRRSAFDVQKSS